MGARRAPKKSQSSRSFEYLHGYTREEQERLYKQAAFLESSVYSGLEFHGVKRMLEVGVGVGAQTPYLLKKNSEMHIVGVDISELQLRAARQHLASHIESGHVELHQRNAEKLIGIGRDFDAAFMCWFLEHVPSPVKVLKEVYKSLRPGASVYCTEVNNASFFVDPYSPAILKFWFEINDHQWSINGHPFMGAQLGNALLKAGFGDIQLEVRPWLYDSRKPAQRKRMIEDVRDLFITAAPQLLAAKRVTKGEIAEMKKEFATLMRKKDSVFFSTFVRGVARKL